MAGGTAGSGRKPEVIAAFCREKADFEITPDPGIYNHGVSMNSPSSRMIGGSQPGNQFQDVPTKEAVFASFELATKLKLIVRNGLLTGEHLWG